jgi:hypothetical protein
MASSIIVEKQAGLSSVHIQTIGVDERLEIAQVSR